MSVPGCWECGLPTGDLVQERPGRPERSDHQAHPLGRPGPAGTGRGSTDHDPWAGIPGQAGTTPEAGRACHRRGREVGLRRGPSLPFAEEGSNQNPGRQAADLAGLPRHEDQAYPSDLGGQQGQKDH